MHAAQPAPSRPTRVRWLVFALACAASWLLYLHRYSWGVVKPAFQRDYPELTATELGVSVLPLSATVEIAAIRQAMRALLASTGHPYLVLRLGTINPDDPGPPHAPRLPADQIIERPQS